MKGPARNLLLFAAVFGLFALVAWQQSPNLALAIFNLGLVSAIMALGVNIQWGYAGLLNVGVMGFAALGGLAAVVVAMPPVAKSWTAGGAGILVALLVALATIVLAVFVWRKLRWGRALAVTIIVIGGFILYREILDPAVSAVERVDAALAGYLGGLGLPIILSWFVGALFAAGASWVVGKITLGLRSDYLAIATLGISEIVVAVLKNEDWLARGVKNVTGLPRPVPYEVDLQRAPWVAELANEFAMTSIDMAAIVVKLSYTALFGTVLLLVLLLAEKALRSPWGRMMRAVRDNEVAAEAMGKDVKGRHLQVFVLGGAVIGMAGAMLTTLDGQFTPASYQPLRFTFLIWVMVIVGGSGNNWGAVLGGLLIWFCWIQAEPVGVWLVDFATSFLDDTNAIRQHFVQNAAFMRLTTMGLILLITLRFAPRGLIPERVHTRA